MDQSEETFGGPVGARDFIEPRSGQYSDFEDGDATKEVPSVGEALVENLSKVESSCFSLNDPPSHNSIKVEEQMETKES